MTTDEQELAAIIARLQAIDAEHQTAIASPPEAAQYEALRALRASGRLSRDKAMSEQPLSEVNILYQTKNSDTIHMDEAIGLYEQAITDADAALREYHLAMIAHDEAVSEYEQGLRELFLGEGDDGEPTTEALAAAGYVAVGKNEADREQRRKMWVNEHQRLDLLDAMQHARKTKYDAERELETCREHRRLYRLRVEALIAAQRSV